MRVWTVALLSGALVGAATACGSAASLTAADQAKADHSSVDRASDRSEPSLGVAPASVDRSEPHERTEGDSTTTRAPVTATPLEATGTSPAATTPTTSQASASSKPAPTLPAAPRTTAGKNPAASPSWSLLTEVVMTRIPDADLFYLTLECERDFTGPGEVMSPRPSAMQRSTLRLTDGMTAAAVFDAPRTLVVQIAVRFSNPNDWPQKKLALLMDGREVGSHTMVSTGNPDSFGLVAFAQGWGMELSAGPHRLELSVTGGDAQGLEVDYVAVRDLQLDLGSLPNPNTRYKPG